MSEKFVSVSAVKKKLNYIFREYAISPLTKKKILGIFDRIPSADVVEVVRCKDCKHYDKEYHQCKLHSEEPDQYYTGFIFCMQEDDFCSYGERKELDNGKKTL